jgi:hypothetical protein
MRFTSYIAFYVFLAFIIFIMIALITEFKISNIAEELCENNGMLLHRDEDIIKTEGWFPFNPIEVKAVWCLDLDKGEKVIVKGV